MGHQKIATNLRTWIEKVEKVVEAETELRRKHDNTSVFDPVLDAETLLYVHTFEVLLQYLKDMLGGHGQFESHLAVLRLAELKAIHEKVIALKSKCEPRYERILKAATDDEQTTKGLRPRPEMFVTVTGESKELEVDTKGVYKPPKTFAVEYVKDRRKGDETEDPEWIQREQERLRQSEFARAITADLLPTPEIVGNGEEELDAVSQKLLKRYKAAEKYGEENMTSVKRRKVDERKYREIKHKQRLLRVGGTLDDLGAFASRLKKT